jgi:hypothetical protein
MEDEYNFSYSYEYIVKHYGDGDDDVELANAIVNIRVSWDDTSTPGYILSYQVYAPTSLPNAYTSNEEEVFEEVVSKYLVNDLISIGVSRAAFKDAHFF